MSIPHKAFLAMLAEKQQILKDNHLIDTTENMRQDIQESHCGSMRVDEPLKGKGYPYNEKTFKPHMMYDPKTGKSYKADTYQDHVRMGKMGYTHEKPEVKEAVRKKVAPKRKPVKGNDMWADAGVTPKSKGWKQGTAAIGISAYTHRGSQDRYMKGDKIFYHKYDIPKTGGGSYKKYIFAKDPKDPGSYFMGDTNRVNESVELEEGPATQNPLVTAFGGMKAAQNTPSYKRYMKRLEKERKERQAKAKKKGMRENPEYDPELGEMNIGEAKSKDIVKGLTDMDGPFTVVAIRNKKVIKQETTKMRNMLPAIVKTMRKDIGPGGTIAIEDKKGTIRGTFKEEVELDEATRHTVYVDIKGKNARSVFRKMEKQVAGMFADSYKSAEYQNNRGNFAFDAKLHDGAERKKMAELIKKTAGVEFSHAIKESFEFQFPDKETAQEFMREVSQKRLGSSTGTKDGKVRTEGPSQAGVGSPTRAHQQMAKIMKKHGGKLISTDEGPRMKKVFKEDIDMINEDDVERREIELFTSNHAQIYRQRIQPIIKNLARKKAKGTYDDKLAIKAWTYAVNDGIKAYNKEFGSSIKLSAAEKAKAAEYLLRHFEDE